MIGARYLKYLFTSWMPRRDRIAIDRKVRACVRACAHYRVFPRRRSLLKVVRRRRATSFREKKLSKRKRHSRESPARFRDSRQSGSLPPAGPTGEDNAIIVIIASAVATSRSGGIDAERPPL